MSSLHTAQQVLWLDPIQPLDAPEHAQLTAAGLSIRCINTLDELQSALSFSQTQALVIRHDTTLDLLQSCQNLMLRAGCALPVVCRVGTSQYVAADSSEAVAGLSLSLSPS